MLVASPAACCGGARHMAPGRERRDAAALGLYAETPADGAAMCTVAGAPAHPGGRAPAMLVASPEVCCSGARNSGAQPSPLPLERWRGHGDRALRGAAALATYAETPQDRAAIAALQGRPPSGGAAPGDAGRIARGVVRRVSAPAGGFGPPGRRSANRARGHHAGPDRTCGQHRAPGQVGGNHGRVPVAHHPQEVSS